MPETKSPEYQTRNEAHGANAEGRTSRGVALSGFHKQALAERRTLLSRYLGHENESEASLEMDRTLSRGGLSCEEADKSIENVLGVFSLPFALALNLRMNDTNYVVPMVVEEPSVVAAASSAARIVSLHGGFVAESDDAIMIAQIQFDQVEDTKIAHANIAREKKSLLAEIDALIPGLVARGGGTRDIETRELSEGYFVVHLLIDCQNAMGANLVNTAAEGISPRIAELVGGRVGLRILSNLADKRCVRVKTQIAKESLTMPGFSADETVARIARASRFAELDPYRATTHNKGIMNGIDAVVLATGNDWRAVEAGAHAFAARDGSYQPLCTWHQDERGDLLGTMEIPMALGIVGGATRVHRGIRLAQEILDVSSAQELGMLAACVGMASNLAALRALATVGIQRGHMSLHARTVAAAAGATGSLVEQVAREIHQQGNVSLQAAQVALARIRATHD